MKNCLNFDDKGIKPVRASGSRWVTHKLNAMKRVLSKYGAYTNHLSALSEDSFFKSSGQAKLRGYHHKWVDAKYMYLLDCAFYVDLHLTCATVYFHRRNIVFVAENHLTHHYLCLQLVAQNKFFYRPGLEFFPG